MLYVGLVGHISANHDIYRDNHDIHRGFRFLRVFRYISRLFLLGARSMVTHMSIMARYMSSHFHEKKKMAAHMSDNPDI